MVSWHLGQMGRQPLVIMAMDLLIITFIFLLPSLMGISQWWPFIVLPLVPSWFASTSPNKFLNYSYQTSVVHSKLPLNPPFSHFLCHLLIDLKIIWFWHDELNSGNKALHLLSALSIMTDHISWMAPLNGC